MSLCRSLCALGLLAVISSAAFGQSVINVPADRPTIQAAIHAASSGDTIIVAPGTYREQIDYVGKAITIVASGGPEVTTIDSDGLDYWNEYPIAAVVRFRNGEGRGSVLNGFTVTGHQHTYSQPTAPIWCRYLSPTILNCIVRDNSGGWSGAIHGDAWIEGCLIENNQSVIGSFGGGIGGAPTVVGCVITNNHARECNGGGIYATDVCDVIDCVITGNTASTDGRQGGGVYGPARLLRCIIADNEVNHYATVASPGAGVDGATSVINCTVVYNRILDTYMYPGGGITHSGDVINSIVWGNDEDQIGWGMTGVVEYSCVEGGYPGTGNTAADPMFTDPVTFDFSLQTGSPCIDTGDPAVSDPDGTRVDMGAVLYPQYVASTTPRFGTSGVNPYSYGSSVMPVIGTTWTAQVNTVAHTGTPTLTVVIGYAGGSSPIPTVMGEILIDPTSSWIFTTIAVPDGGGVGHHSMPIPLHNNLIGETVYTQAAALESGAIELANGYDLHLGL